MKILGKKFMFFNAYIHKVETIYVKFNMFNKYVLFYKKVNFCFDPLCVLEYFVS